MNRRTVLKSCAGFAFAYAFRNEQPWESDRPLFFHEPSSHFSMTVDGISVAVNYAAGSYSYVNLNIAKPAEIVITALTPGFWKNGVEILPSRHGIRPIMEGNSIRFTMKHPEKLAISRPGDYYANAPLMFLFGNATCSRRPGKNEKAVRYYAPGVYREDIHVKSNETIFLDEGAVVYGSLNFWDVTNAHVYGAGVVIHDGPQNPGTDEGWQHRPDWHGLTAHEATNISVKDVTIIVRSRTWMMQLQGCKDVLFENIKVIGATAGNANQDGIDWLGCGNTVVRNCFFRCSDDIFAIYGNTGFYDNTVAIPGRDVENILIEGCVLSTSISNIMRVGWPRKVFNSRNVVMRNCDVIHAGQGGCIVPFALAEFWADPDGKGVHSDYVFDDIRMDNIYSLTQLVQSQNGSGSVKNIRFKNIRLSTPPLVNSVISGACSGISFENIKFCDQLVSRLSFLGLDENTASITIIKSNAAKADFHYTAGLLKAGQTITFDARASVNSKSIRSYAWNFGDGFFAEGLIVTHVFQDSYGTRMSSTGQFQVMLTTTDKNGIQDVIVKPVVIGAALQAASVQIANQNGLGFRHYPGVKTTWAEIEQKNPDATGVTKTVKEFALTCKAPYTLLCDGYLEVPVSGGYTFYMMSREGVYLQLNTAVLLNSDATLPQACNTVGNTVQLHTAVSILSAGLHSISFGYKQDLGEEAFAFYWQGPASKLEQISMNRFFQINKNTG